MPDGQDVNSNRLQRQGLLKEPPPGLDQATLVASKAGTFTAKASSHFTSRG
jgi:hypothetical protein